MKRNVFRKIVQGLSFTSAMFVFQACYGTPQDFGDDMLIEGQVKSKVSGVPIEGIKVSVSGNGQFEMTDEAGKFSFYTIMFDQLTLQFQDVDSTENGSYVNRDVILSDFNENVYLDIALEQK